MWYKKLLLALWGLLWDEQGEGEADPPGGPAPEPEPSPEPEPEPTPEPEPEAPAFGDFGDAPKTIEEAQELLKKIYGAHQTVSGDHTELKRKTTVTEQNSGLLNQALKSMGIEAVKTEDGYKLQVKEPSKKTGRFTDDHKKKFVSYFREGGDDFLSLLGLYVQDMQDQDFDRRVGEARKSRQATTNWETKETSAIDRMLTIYPGLDGQWKNDKPTSKTFDKAHHELAEKIWREKYGKDPYGQLWAALEAGEQLGISKKVITAAEKRGYDLAKSGKKILGTVDKGKKPAVAGKEELSQEAFFKLSKEEQEEYNKKQVGL